MSELHLIVAAIDNAVNPALYELADEIYEELGAMGYLAAIEKKIPEGNPNISLEYARSITVHKHGKPLCVVTVYSLGTNILMCDRIPSTGNIEHLDPLTLTKDQVKQAVKNKIGIIHNF